MKKKIYIAGKVTGEDKIDCIIKFGNMATVLEGLGFEPVNPLEVVGDWKVTWREAMNRCIKALVDCDGIYFLEDHRSSPGATIEKRLSYDLEIKPFFDIDTLTRHQWNS